MLVIYGECDADQITVRCHPPTALTELEIDIEDNLTLKIRSLALFALGHMFFDQGDMDQSIVFLVQARNALEGNVEADDQLLTAINALLLDAYEADHKAE